VGDRRGDDEMLEALASFVRFVARSATSQQQRKRLARAAGSSITGAEMEALRGVQKHEPVTATELADRLGLDRTTVSRLVGHLQALELVARSTDLGDRRRSLVALTGEGTALLATMDQVSARDYLVATKGWSPDDRTRLAVPEVRRRRLGHRA
jgi:DNA-binding MarR family transcriptional regulator